MFPPAQRLINGLPHLFVRLRACINLIGNALPTITFWRKRPGSQGIKNSDATSAVFPLQSRLVPKFRHSHIAAG